MPDALDLAQVALDRLRELAPEARRVAVAVSGGGDSVALACLFADAGVDIVVLHVDHALRPNSATDATFVEGLAANLGVPFAMDRVEVSVVADRRGWNLEDAARRVRHATLQRLAKAHGADVVALAHTVEDQAETVLLQAFRGVAYLHGMPERRGRIVRPLLTVGRSELRGWLDRRRQPWRDDPTNEDLARARAWVRHAVMPRLEAYAPGVAHRLARLAKVQRDLAVFVREETRRRVREVARLVPQQGAPATAETRAAAAEGLDAGGLVAQPIAVQREALAGLLAAAGVPVDLHRLDLVRGHLTDETPWRTSVGDGAWARVAYGRVSVARASQPAAGRVVADPVDLPPGAPPSVLEGGQVVLRGREPGDTLALPGGHRSLADVLIDARVPREARDGLRVLARGSEVVWVEGLAQPQDDGVVLVEDEDHRWMRRALELAEAARAAGELPVGAVVVLDGEVIGEGVNARETEGDPVAHAEIRALQAAARARGDWRLTGATLVVTLEPCPMCFGAVMSAHVARVVYGASNPREGALGSVIDLSTEAWKRRVEVRGGVRAREAAALLERFFAERRA